MKQNAGELLSFGKAVAGRGVDRVEVVRRWVGIDLSRGCVPCGRREAR